ncbi:MAG: DUF58 domain-containing protein [Deltaproteobacteria bacterium]|nr:DUF58 domain-containing protein [Deltaproteobacteria bacterium]
MTPEGKWFLLITLGVGAAAINTGNNLLYVALSMNLSLILVSGFLSEWCIRRTDVRVRHANEAFASRESLLAVTCSAAGKRFPSISLKVSLPLGGNASAVRFPEIPAGGTATRVVAFRPERRGPIAVPSCSISTKFPFALFEKARDVDPGAALVAYPEPDEALEHVEKRQAREASGSAAPSGRRGDGIRGARRHLPADPVGDIHWKASAKAGRLMVKEREKEAARVADLRIPVPCTPQELERAVSRTCAAVLRCEREGRPYRIFAGGRLRVDASGGCRRTDALTVLALVRPDGTAGGGDAA